MPAQHAISCLETDKMSNSFYLPNKTLHLEGHIWNWNLDLGRMRVEAGPTYHTVSEFN
jgi:hypothetical protein